MKKQFFMNRRTLMLGAAASFSTIAFSGPAVAAGAAGKKFILVFLRGGLDGIGALAPITDPFYAGLRRELAIPSAQLLAMGGGFGLNPRMPNLHQMVLANEAVLIHGVGGPITNRSHFDSQEGVERGVTNFGLERDGWMSRLLVNMGATAEGIAIGTSVPKVLIGDADIFNYAPARLPDIDVETMDRIVAMTNSDTIIGAPIARIVDDTKAGRTNLDVSGGDFEIAATLLANQDPALAGMAVVDFGGWDHHDGAYPLTEGYGLGGHLQILDTNLQIMKTTLGTQWSDTVVMVVSEFGRNVEINGSEGFDHGIAGLCMLCGGAVNGLSGGVRGDFAGLGPTQLVDGIDLAVSTDMRAIFKGIMRDHMGISVSTMNSGIFPDATSIAPMNNLIV